MKAEEAAAIVNGMIFRPGWRLRAEPAGKDFLMSLLFTRAELEHRIIVQASVPTVDTSYVADNGTYTVPKRMDPAAMIDVSDLHDEADIAAALLTQLVGPFQLHEDREFLRVRAGGRWAAPLHPHTDEGIAAWQRLTEPAAAAEAA